MARDFSKNTSNYMSLGIDKIGPLLNGAAKVAIHLRANIDSLNNGGTGVNYNSLLGWIINASSLGCSFSFGYNGTNYKLHLNARSKSTDALQSLVGSTTVAAGEHSAGGVIDYGAATITVYLDGAQDGTGGVAFGASTYTHGTATGLGDCIGCHSTAPGSTQIQTDGGLAEVAIWASDVPSADDFAALAKGASPLLVRPSGLVCYFPLVGRTSPEPDLVGGLTGTITGTVAARDHPRVFSPLPPRVKRSPMGVDGAASIAGAATVAAAARVSYSGAASIAASATVAAAPTLTEISQFDAVIAASQGRKPILQCYIDGLPDVLCTDLPAGGDQKTSGYCLLYDGVNDYSATAAINDLFPIGDFTSVQWFKMTSPLLAGIQPLWSWWSGIQGWACYIEDSGGEIVLATVDCTVSSTLIVTAGVQYCLVVSQGGGQGGIETRFTLFAFDSDGALSSVTRKYISGADTALAGNTRAERNTCSAATTSAFTIGGWSGSYYASARIGYTAIYSRAFTQSECERIVYRIVDAKWTEYWAFLAIQIVCDEQSGTKLKNSSSAGATYNMTVTNGAAWDVTDASRPWTITYRPYMTAISAAGQDLEARATRTTVSGISFQVLDPGADSGWWFTAYLKRVAQAVRRKSAYVFMGFDEILEEDYEVVLNGSVESVEPLRQRGYEIRIGDAIRFARAGILLGKTRLAADITNASTTIQVDSLFNFRGRTRAGELTGTTIKGYLRIDDEIIKYDAHQASPVAFTSCTRGQFTSYGGGAAAAHTAGATVTELFIVPNVNPIRMMLNLMMSNTGQEMAVQETGLGISYDVFTRFTADDGSTTDGRGAAMSFADVDRVAIEAVQTASYTNYAGDFVISDSIDNLKDWIEENILRPLGAYFVTLSNGKLSIATWATPSSTGVETLEHGDQSMPEPEQDVSSIINAIEVRCDLDLISGEYGKLITHDDLDSGRDHGPSAPLRIDSPWIRTTGITGTGTYTPTPSTIVTALKNALFARFADPQALITATVGLEWWSQEIGTGIKYQHEEIPDFVDGERGLMGVLMQIVGRTLDVKRARVVLKLMRTP